MVFLKISQHSKENICAGISFAIKLQAGGLQLHLKQNLVEVLSCEFCEIFKDIYFANIYEGLPIKNKIFTRVSFRKILGFFYKWNRQLFYHERTSSYIPLKILERVNGYFSEFLSVLASEYTVADRNMFKVDKKGMFQGCYSGIFKINLENIFEVYDRV